jgi:hypothetical protein
MKVVGSADIVTSESFTLDISPYLATALGARKGATLYAVGFRHCVPELRQDVPVDPDLLAAWREFLTQALSEEDSQAGSSVSAFAAEDDKLTRAFQRREQLDVDGVVGPQTLGRAIKLGFRWAFATPQVSIVASPFPTASWGKLFRIRVLRAPRSGSAHALLHAVRVLGFACRFMELVEPIDLHSVELFSRRHLPRYRRSPTEDATVAITPVDLVLELPASDFHLRDQKDQSDDKVRATFGPDNLGKLPEALAEEVAKLHNELRSFLSGDRTRSPLARLQSALQTVLAAIESDLLLAERPDLQVVALEPMLTLNGIAEINEGLGLAREKIKIDRRSDDDSSTLTLDISPWRPLMWHQEQQMPLVGRADQNKLLAISYADSEERIICWHFYEVRQRVIAELDIRVPSDVSDFIWREWVYDVIRSAHGSVVASYTSPRLKNGVTACRVVVVFPFREDAPPGGFGDVSLIIGCFNELLGSRGRGEQRRYLDWCRHLGGGGYHHAAMHALGNAKREGSPRWRGLLEGTAYHMEVELETAKMWSSPVDASLELRGTQGKRYIDRFKRNPFLFTRALNLQDYKELYPAIPDLATRLQLAQRIIGIILGGENVSLVGAHRCGKSTVLNLVEDMLKASQTPSGAPNQPEPEDAKLVIPIRLDAAVTPINALPAEIIRLLDRKSKEAAVGSTGDVWWSGVWRAVADAFKSVASANVRAKVGFPALLGILDLEVEVGDEAKPTKTISPAQAVRAALDLLRMTLDKLELGNVTFLVMIDELSDGLLWGDEKPSSAAWRSMIELPEFRSIRWLVASSRPMRQEMSYSPFSNVFREETVGCLTLAEANRCIDAFSDADLADRARAETAAALERISNLDRQAPEEPAASVEAHDRKLTPVVTPRGRTALLKWTGRLPFLLQVACSYVFDRATQREVPIITSDLVQRTLEERVAMELSDYFEAQWSEFQRDPQMQQEIIVSLIRKYGSAEDIWKTALSKRAERQAQAGERKPSANRRRATDTVASRDAQRGELGPATRRALSRSGLEGADGEVAPLAAFWLLSTVTPRGDDSTRRQGRLTPDPATSFAFRPSAPPGRPSAPPGRPTGGGTP